MTEKDNRASAISLSPISQAFQGRVRYELETGIPVQEINGRIADEASAYLETITRRPMTPPQQESPLVVKNRNSNVIRHRPPTVGEKIKNMSTTLFHRSKRNSR